MSHQRGSASPLAKGAAAVFVVILVNVLLRVVGMPDIDLPAVSLPNVPGWIHTVLKAKNWLLAGLVVLVAATTLAGEFGKRRR